MKILVCGDLHTKFHILKDVEKLIDDYDKLIFLGDYVDEWNEQPSASYELLKEIVEFKGEHKDKVVLLFGNHCLSEWKGGIFQCSGYNPITHLITSPIFEYHKDLFDIAYAEDNILFTHAGLTFSWAKEYLGTELSSPRDYAHLLNYKFHTEDENFMRGLAKAGSARGGSGMPSPIWVDRSELIYDRPPDFRQVVGHSPVVTVLSERDTGDLENANIVFCDTHSLYSDRTPIGDNSLLEILDGKFYKKELYPNQDNF